ncbi:hypothetical protein GH714_044028 [Hevea brasiliensis]|uniref:Ribulose bisphosphate carboxylase large chain n=1 Tax=Hevea brasiliensis TaxID=3981 RepID=A0A6A6K0E1_HEVBR|nr:hypothetical protein GH714_044028 [Hevea brasiliensis]
MAKKKIAEELEMAAAKGRLSWKGMVKMRCQICGQVGHKKRFLKDHPMSQSHEEALPASTQISFNARTKKKSYAKSSKIGTADTNAKAAPISSPTTVQWMMDVQVRDLQGEGLMSPQTETKTSVGFKAGVKDYKLTYYTPEYQTKDTDILAAFRVTPQPRVPPEEARAAVAAESSTGTWTTVWTDGLTSLDRYKGRCYGIEPVPGKKINILLM